MWDSLLLNLKALPFEPALYLFKACPWSTLTSLTYISSAEELLFAKAERIKDLKPFEAFLFKKVSSAKTFLTFLPLIKSAISLAFRGVDLKFFIFALASIEFN